MNTALLHEAIEAQQEILAAATAANVDAKCSQVHYCADGELWMCTYFGGVCNPTYKSLKKITTREEIRQELADALQEIRVPAINREIEELENKLKELKAQQAELQEDE